MIPYLLCGCDAIACSASQQYYWLKRPDSIMGTVSEKKVLDWEEGIDRLLEFTQKKKVGLPQSFGISPSIS